MRNLFLCVYSLIVLVSMSGCGYTTSSTLPSNLKKIYVEQFDNKIVFTSASNRNVYFPLLEVDTRNAILDRYQFDGNLDISRSHQADLILKGKLLNYYRRGLRFDDKDTAEEYRIHVVVSLELWNTQTQTMMWSESRFVGSATYFLSGPEATTEESAVEEALVDLSRRIVERTVENW